MATIPDRATGPKYVDKARVREALDKAYAVMGFVPDPTATPERAQERMREAGIRPEDNLFSRGIIAMREE